MSPHRGVVAIELAAVIGVTFVMAALAVSAYRTHAARSEVSRTIVDLAPVKALVAYAFEHTGFPPASNRDIPDLQDAMLPHRLLEAVAVKHGHIEVRFGGDAAAGLRGKVLNLTPFETTDGDVVWRCGHSPARVGLHPLGFLGGTSPQTKVLTTVEPRYLPPDCR